MTRHIFLRLALVAFAVYVVVTLATLWAEIEEQKADLEQMTAYAEYLAQQKSEKESLLQDLDRFMNQQAHENGWVEPGADVFKPYQ